MFYKVITPASISSTHTGRAISRGTLHIYEPERPHTISIASIRFVFTISTEGFFSAMGYNREVNRANEDGTISTNSTFAYVGDFQQTRILDYDQMPNLLELSMDGLCWNHHSKTTNLNNAEFPSEYAHVTSNSNNSYRTLLTPACSNIHAHEYGEYLRGFASYVMYPDEVIGRTPNGISALNFEINMCDFAMRFINLLPSIEVVFNVN